MVTASNLCGNTSNIDGDYLGLVERQVELCLFQTIGGKVGSPSLAATAKAQSRIEQSRRLSIEKQMKKQFHKLLSLTEAEIDREHHWHDRFMSKEI